MTARHPATNLVAAGLALGAAAVATVLMWHPWAERDRLGYDDLEPIRDAMWRTIVVDALAYAVIGVTFAIAVCALARSRGAVWATVGGALTALGGIAFAMGEFAFVSLSWYATEPAALSADQGTRLLDHAVDHPEHGMVVQMAGFGLFTLGSILLVVALIRSRAVPLWLPIAFFVLVVAQFAPVPSRALDFIQVGNMALLVVLAWMFVTTDATPAGRRSARAFESQGS